MFIVRDTESDEIVAITTRKRDAEAINIAHSGKSLYKIEEVKAEKDLQSFIEDTEKC